jgi:hypothetical protein
MTSTSPVRLLDTYHDERHPVAARVLRTNMAQVKLARTDDRAKSRGVDSTRRLCGVGGRQDAGGTH